MLYSLFLYQASTGISVWEKSFDAEMDPQQIIMFGSFFSAIQNFVKEIVTHGTKGLQSLDLGDNLVLISPIPELDLEIVTISDKRSKDAVKRLHDRILKDIRESKDLFHWENFDGDIKKFRVLDAKFLNTVRDSSGLFDSRSLAGNQRDFIQSMFAQIPDPEQNQQQILVQEKSSLLEKLKVTTSLPEKIKLLEQIRDYAQKLKDVHGFEQYQKDIQKIQTDFADLKQRAIYFLRQAKEVVTKITSTLGMKRMEDLDLKPVYLNLYSFSSKLRALGNIEKADEFKNKASILIDQVKINPSAVSSLIREIINLPDDIESYLILKNQR